jgi:multiple sugar transport system permease protein
VTTQPKLLPADPDVSRIRGRRGGARGRRPWAGYLFVAPYVALILAFGIGPSLYAIKLAVTDSAGHFAGLANFSRVVHDFRFLPAVEHVAAYIAIWLTALVVLVVLLSLLVHAVPGRLSGTLRLLYYLPGALAGASSVMLWLFLLDPTASPVGWLLRALGSHSFNQSISPHHLPFVFALIAFWTGAGGWILVMYGALNNIPAEVIEASRIDGANVVQRALSIELPMLRKWIAYMVVLSLAAGTQLFVEPTLLSQASNAVVPNDYSINQLAYQYAFNLDDLNGSAAISVVLLLVALVFSAVFVLRGRLFETEPQ